MRSQDCCFLFRRIKFLCLPDDEASYSEISPVLFWPAMSSSRCGTTNKSRSLTPGLATMSGMRNRKAAVRYNPSVDGRSDTAMKEEEHAPPTTRSKRGSPKPMDRFDPAWEGRSDTKIKRSRGETPSGLDRQRHRKLLTERHRKRLTAASKLCFRRNLQARLR